MNRYIIISTALLLIGQSLQAAAQPQDENGGRAREERSQALSVEQKTEIKKILSRYSAASLTAQDAKAIHSALREAGIRGGPAINEVVRDAGFDPHRLRELDPPPDRPKGGGEAGGKRERSDKAEGQKQGGGYSIEQATSDRAQQNTIAFNGLAFMTGDFCSDTFIPPGKVSDFFGFQYMRDIDRGELGHNTSFLPRIANNLLAVLNDSQKRQLIGLAKEQAPQIRELALKRFPLIKAFRRNMEGDLPKGSTGLDRQAVVAYAAKIFELDGMLAYRRAQVLGNIVKALDTEQKNALSRLKFGDSSTWPEVGDQVDKRSISHEEHVAVMTYASELFSWYAGSLEADTYFCPERHSTYFGGFYLKDRPAMGNPGYSISTSLTGDGGEKMLELLTPAQSASIVGVVENQRPALKEIVETRRKIASELRLFITGSADREKVAALARRYGELDGEAAYLSAAAYAKVYTTLSPAQKAKLMALRNLDGYTCQGAYLYSDNMREPVTVDCDFLLGKPNKR